ncbi:MAG: dihydrodipicolinate synthase family protein [Nitrososphaerota archaeon]|nr:dihydrodipicolinate synthase family protein [Nitrososphaerota archaeon]MDG6983425.1 dihydrodipicolinate synthase family protein [Nitrososphaerota archaeon]
MAKGGAQEIKGLFTALITPFDARGRVNPEALQRLVSFQVSKGAEGIFPCGSTGLGPMLSPEERKSVAATVVGSAKGRVPVVVQVGAADTGTAAELAVHAEDVGAYAVASLTPYYYKPGERAVAKHFEAILKKVDIPVLAYNIPQFTGNNLSPAAVQELAKSGVAGIKDSSRDFLHLLDLLDAVPDGFVVMNGTEEYGLHAVMSGADGLVSGGASALPELFSSMLLAQRKGDAKSALAAQKRVREVKDLVKSGPISAYYAILKERGIDCGVPRPPFLPTDQSSSAAAMAGLRALGLV